ncbi:MAG: glutamate decarboxylase [Bacillaceae bacterium]|nr:glutamate decarboxylase [Bacillaceae bacterium]
MWTVIYIAPSARSAEKIQDRLTAEGFLVKIRQVSSSSNQYEILVPEGELGEVQEILSSILH